MTADDLGWRLQRKRVKSRHKTDDDNKGSKKIDQKTWLVRTLTAVKH